MVYVARCPKCGNIIVKSGSDYDVQVKCSNAKCKSLVEVKNVKGKITTEVIMK